jgi:hypothetical protein
VTGGSFTEIQSGRELLDNLREHLNVDGYVVSDADGLPVNGTNQDVAEQVKLGTPVAISNNHALPEKFQVAFRDVKKDVLLEGGEALQLYVQQNGAFHDIVAREYKRLTQASAYLRQGAGGQETRYLLRVHQPVRSEGSLVEFPISLQRDTHESHFTQRPAEIWLEITPLDDSESGQLNQHEPYVFYDTNFAPDQPVPVVACPAVDWRNWPRARVKFWCKYRATDPVLAVGLRDASYRTPQNVPSVNGVQLRVDTSESRGIYRVYVAEYHSEPVTDIDALRVQLHTHPQYKPKFVRHQFDREARLATHSFEFDASQRKGIEDFEGSRIVVTKADDIKDAALQIAEDSPIEVSVQVDSGFHTTGAGSNGQ